MGLLLFRAAQLLLNELIPGRAVIIQDGWEFRRCFGGQHSPWLSFERWAVTLKKDIWGQAPSCSPWVKPICVTNPFVSPTLSSCSTLHKFIKTAAWEIQGHRR